MTELVKPVKEFTEQQAKQFIINGYSNANIALIKLLIRYWSGKHPTQVYYRQALRQLLKEKRVYPVYITRSCYKGLNFKQYVSNIEHESLDDALAFCREDPDTYDVEIWCYQSYNSEPHPYLRTMKLPTLAELDVDKK